MIESSGQIITGRAIEDLPNVIEEVAGADGYYRTAYKALVAPTSEEITTAGPSTTKGSWCKIAKAGDDARFLGVIGNDTTPEANIILDTNRPALEMFSNYSVRKGGVVTIERNGMIPVKATGDIQEQDLLELGADGTFKKQATPNVATAVGKAYESAANGERFLAYIKAL